MIDKELIPYIEASRKNWPIPAEQLPVAEWRQRYEDLMVRARRPRPPTLTVTDLQMGDAARPVGVRLYRTAATGAQPAFVFMHGGGWVIGSIESHDEIAADIAADTGCAVISIEYALAPEEPFPHAFNDCLSVVRHIFEHHRALDIDPARVLVGGDSAGANLAAALALHLRGQTPALLGQVLLYPCTDANSSRPSFKANANGPVITAAQIEWFLRQYLPDPAGYADPRAVPMAAEHLRGSPPAFVGVAQNDPLCDEGIAYAERLRDDGVPVHLDKGPGLIHGYLRARAACAAAQSSYDAMRAWIETILRT